MVNANGSEGNERTGGTSRVLVRVKHWNGNECTGADILGSIKPARRKGYSLVGQFSQETNR